MPPIYVWQKTLFGVLPSIIPLASFFNSSVTVENI